MTLRQISITVLLVATSAPFAPSQTPGSAWKLTASVPQRSPGAPIEVNLALRNLSTAALSIVDRSPLADYRVTVVDGSGSLVRYTQHARALIDSYQNGAVLRAVLQKVDSGAEVRTVISLADLYGELGPGRYSVTVERVGALEASAGHVVRPKGLALLPCHSRCGNNFAPIYFTRSERPQEATTVARVPDRVGGFRVCLTCPAQSSEAGGRPPRIRPRREMCSCEIGRLKASEELDGCVRSSCGGAGS